MLYFEKTIYRRTDSTYCNYWQTGRKNNGMDKENEKNLQAVNSERTEKIMSQYRKHLMACLAIILIEFIFSQYMVDFLLDEKLYRTGGMLFWGAAVLYPYSICVCIAYCCVDKRRGIH